MLKIHDYLHTEQSATQQAVYQLTLLTDLTSPFRLMVLCNIIII